jgi:hypothetical protein
VYFRREIDSNSGHRNTFRNNQILDNGSTEGGYGVYVEPCAGELLFAENRIADTRAPVERTQRFGVFRAAGAGTVRLENNTMEGHIEKNYAEGVPAKRRIAEGP